MSEWISVKDKLPKDHEEVMIHLTDGTTEYAMRYRDDDGNTGWIGFDKNADCEWVIFDGSKMVNIIDFWMAEENEEEPEELEKEYVFDVDGKKITLSIASSGGFSFRIKGATE